MKSKVPSKTAPGIRKEILQVAKRIGQKDGVTPTSVSYLSIIRSETPTTLNHGILQPSFCIVVQGAKKIHIGQDIFKYGVGSFVVSAIDLPTSGQIIEASKAAPYLGLKVEFDPKEIAAIVMEAKLNLSDDIKRTGPAAFVGQADESLQDAVVRLVKLVDQPEDAAFLADNLKREILYRILRSEYGKNIYRNLIQDQREVGVGRAITWLKNNYNQPLKMEDLAKASNMSVSSLHHKFKAVTAMGPLQYQKQLRLQEARRLIFSGKMDAGSAAFEVGYESQSQFTREYRRLFGAPPLQDIKKLKSHPEVDELSEPQERIVR
ncbi:AraC family transcriptional regulator [Bdellovibrio sp. NC01]|uniref:AraC family transcriptional regulator n=1 Tax=Bdellovibrio sp. NC01 TaxID=2220073 RepID=UPI001159A875|nr:AraC family transcriptional regulator [Bdellovibrio sp. NC01]QDK36363.1 AraC family transcriptional regulator [Bdellovibrio sp. NC01]